MTTDTEFGDVAVNGKPALYDPAKSASSQEVPGAVWESSYSTFSLHPTTTKYPN